MQTYRTTFIRVAAFLFLQCSASFFSQSATACPISITGSKLFTAAPGGSQSQTWTATNDAGWPENTITITITGGADVFTVDRSQLGVSSIPGESTFIITFKPGANASGTITGSFTTTGACSKTFTLTGTVAASGVVNSISSDVEVIVAPNPSTGIFSITANNTQSMQIGMYDLLGKEITFTTNTKREVNDNTESKSSTWILDASNVPAGSYIVRIIGQSMTGYPFIKSKKVIIAR